MLRKFYIILVVAIIASDIAGLPPCHKNDESCLEHRMHPDDPVAERNAPQPHVIEGETTTEYWRQHAHQFIAQQLNAMPNKKRAKNVIMFLGDGMGLTTIAAARNVIGGEQARLSFEHFPYTGLSKTYSIDKIVSDSACTATAYLCGVKGFEGTIGVNGNVERGDCIGVLDPANHVFSIAKWAMDAGKWAGVVTTTRITHASPAGVYAHIADRDWENDAEVKAECGADSKVPDIAYQLIHGEVGSKLKLVMGGGKKHFIDSQLYVKGERTDGRNLIDEYLDKNPNNVYVETLTELNAVDFDKTERLLGVFQDSHMLYHLETNETTDQPTLEQMTRKAIEMLSRNEEGYFIFIEGGRIDLAHHDNMARIALDETAEFSKAIQLARSLTSEEDTLIVVTADHSHAFSISGYPSRGADIFGRTRAMGDDGVPLMTLSYANGPSYERFYDTVTFRRRDPTQLVTGDKYDSFPATVPLDLETHGGDDVAVYASGPWAHLFTGVYEQNTIPHMMGYASCLGSGLKMCDKKPQQPGL